MLQQILLLAIPIISTKAMYIRNSNTPGHEFSTKLCPTRTANYEYFGSIVKTEKCIYPTATDPENHPGFGAATDSLSGDRIPHWCLQDYINVTHNYNYISIPSGCSLWVKEVDDMPIENINVDNKTGIRKLREVRIQLQPIPNGNLVTSQECMPMRTPLNSESNTLKRTDHWCRQEKILLPFAGDDPFPSGCSCYVRD